MKRKSVAAVLSGAVFPGIGQYYLGQRKRALLFLVPALVAGYVYFGFALNEADAVVGQMLGGRLPADPAALSALLEARPTPPRVTIAGIVFLASWIGSVIDVLLRRRP